MTLFSDGELAVSQCVPEFNGLISASTDNLSVISGERDGKNIIGMTYEAAGGFSSVEIPETKGFIP